MGDRTIVPLIDLVFLTLGSVLAAMTQMERVESIPVAVARTTAGCASVRRGEFDVVAITLEDVRWNGELITYDEIPDRAPGRQVVLRAERSLPTQQTLELLGELIKAGADVSIEVKQSSQAPQQETPRG